MRDRSREAVRRHDPHVVPGRVEHLPKRDEQTLRQQEHVEQQRANHGDTSDGERRPRPFGRHGPPRQRPRRHRRTREMTLRRSSVHEAARPATTPSGMANATASHAIALVTCTKTSVVSYRHWKNRLTRPLGGDRHENPEDRAGDGNQQPLEHDFDQNRPRGDAHQPQNADDLAPLFGAHHHQRQQKSGAAGHRDRRNRLVKSLEHRERIVAPARARRGLRDRARQPSRDRRGDLAAVRWLDQGQIHRADLVAGFRNARILRQCQEIGEVDVRLEAFGRRTCADPAPVRRCRQRGTWSRGGRRRPPPG